MEQIMANIRNQLIAGKNNITQFVDKAFCFFSSLILRKYFISHITFIPRTLKVKVMIDVHLLCQIKIKSNFLKDSSFTDINLILIRNSYSAFQHQQLHMQNVLKCLRLNLHPYFAIHFMVLYFSVLNSPNPAKQNVEYSDSN